jgi:hypothetical protein
VVRGALLIAFCLAACSSSGGPDAVADAFAEAYFRRMDQEKAKEYTALGATAMLDAELREVADVRKDGYDPAEATSRVTLRRGDAVPREQRVRFLYEITIENDGSQTSKEADVELTRINGAWKVVRVGLRPK